MLSNQGFLRRWLLIVFVMPNGLAKLFARVSTGLRLAQLPGQGGAHV